MINNNNNNNFNKKICIICNKENSNYKCPKCKEFYCCIECFKKHKENCNNNNNNKNIILNEDENNYKNKPLNLDEDEDVILTEDELNKLKNNKKIMNMVKNKNLKKIIKEIDNAKFKKKTLEKIQKKDKNFLNFTLEILKTLGFLNKEGDFEIKNK